MKSLYRNYLFFTFMILALTVDAKPAGEIVYDCTQAHTSACLAQTFKKEQDEFCRAGDTKKELEIDKLSQAHYDSKFTALQMQQKNPDTSEASFDEITEKLKRLKKLSGPAMGIRKEWRDKQLIAAKKCLGTDLKLPPTKVAFNEVNNAANTWATQFLVGYMQQSSYETENGKSVSKGLQQGGALAQFSFNGRWIQDDNIEHKMPGTAKPGLVNVDLGFVFSQSGVCNPDKKPQTDPNPDTDSNMTSETEVNENVHCDEVKFNDVADSVDVYAKLLWSPTSMKWMRSDNYDSILSFGPIVGFKSKDVRALNGDSVNSYYGLGLEYNAYNHNIMTHNNINPRARLTMAGLKYEEYASLDKDEWRFVIVGHYHPVADSDFVVGFRANLGKGTDDVGIFIGVEKTAEDLLSFF
ncbi:hypothetical protein [Thalassomonas haliotis]|uniref:Porin n=1 Tax=Thalassomonas haliotis TaxID=485448 RepID=A0ABY7VMA6_9GAMM|nr:hypothetical protein [Thalassomonas haliotis]WDE14334.1 hypothetical protein H3N35_13460 [Thalassomonas haliotis]